MHKLNSVLHPGYTDADRKRDRLIDREEWLAHVHRNWSTVDQLWLFELEHFEGEYRIGLGRRLFGDHEDENAWEVEWFQRMSPAHSWGLAPGFKLAVQSWNSRRQPIAYHSTEPTSLLVPVVCELTHKSTVDLPRLSQACMQAVRVWAHENDRWRAPPPPKAARIANQQKKMLGLRAGPARAKSESEPSEAESEFSESEASVSEPDSAPDESVTETESDEEREGTHTEVVRQHSPCESRKHLRRNRALLPVAKAVVAPPVTAALEQNRASRKQKQGSRASEVMHPAPTSSTGASSSSATAVVKKHATSRKKGGEVKGRAVHARRAVTEAKRRKQARS